MNIEKNIPIPPDINPNKNLYEDTLMKMEYGDSVLLPNPYRLSQFKKTANLLRFRTISHKVEGGFRIWKLKNRRNISNSIVFSGVEWKKHFTTMQVGDTFNIPNFVNTGAVYGLSKKYGIKVSTRRKDKETIVTRIQ